MAEVPYLGPGTDDAWLINNSSLMGKKVSHMPLRHHQNNLIVVDTLQVSTLFDASAQTISAATSRTRLVRSILPPFRITLHLVYFSAQGLALLNFGFQEACSEICFLLHAMWGE